MLTPVQHFLVLVRETHIGKADVGALRLLREGIQPLHIDYYSGQSFIEIRNRAMIAMMFDTDTLSRLLGHENASITQRYLEGITDEGVISIARKTGVLENIR